MENPNCLVVRLVILITGIILAVIIASLLALGVITLQPAALYAAAFLGALIAAFDIGAIINTQPYESVRKSALCLGLTGFAAALVLLIIAVIAISFGLVLTGLIGVILGFLLTLALWVALADLWQFARHLAARCA